MSVLSHQIFQADHVAVFKIPPGEILLSRWKTDPENIVWQGSLRLLEQEVELDANDSSGEQNLLRLKLELYNHEKLTQFLEDFVEVENDMQWAEVWYNPFLESELHYKIANDGEDTIRVTPQSSLYYKIIAQLPGSGYHPLECDNFNVENEEDKENTKKAGVLQIALGLKFPDKFTAVLFSEALAMYRRRFRSVQDTKLYDKHLLVLQRKITGLRIEDELKEATPMSDFEDDEFGNFVGSSYD